MFITRREYDELKFTITDLRAEIRHLSPRPTLKNYDIELTTGRRLDIHATGYTVDPSNAHWTQFWDGSRFVSTVKTELIASIRISGERSGAEKHGVEYKGTEG